MALAYYPKCWSTKPPMGVQIQRGHPLSSGLLFCALANESGGFTLQDLAYGQVGTATTGTIWAPSPYGPAIAFGGSDNVDFGSAAVTANRQVVPTTYVIWFKATTLSVTQVIFGRNDGNTVNVGWWIDITSGNILRFVTEASSVNMVADTSSPPSLNTWYMFVVVGDGSQTAANQALYLNGVLQAHGTDFNGSGTIGDDTTKALTLGSYSTGGLKFNGHISQAMIYNRQLTAGQIIQLYTNPYCFLQPQSPQRRYWAPPLGSTYRPIGNKLRPAPFKPGTPSRKYGSVGIN
jgi:Concanavalin A-like lectin/glucanases superfamily